MLDYIRIACAIPAVSVGNPEINADNICRLLEKANRENSDVVLFPELSLTGYTCADLFFDKGLQTAVLRGIEKLGQWTKAHAELTAVVGAPIWLRGRLFNCALVISGGAVRGIVPKSCFANQESRWFSRADALTCNSIHASEIGLADHADIPVGNDLMFCLGDGTRMAVELGEDLLATNSHTAVLADNGAELIVNLSAAAAAVGKQARLRKLMQAKSDVCNCVYAYASAGCMESTQDFLFDGRCMIAENGAILAENDMDLPVEDLLICDADLGKVRAVRQRKQSSMGVLRTASVRLADCKNGDLRSNGDLYPICREPFVRKETLQTDAYSIFRMQAVALARRLKLLNAKAVLGVSGGLDSTLALLVAVEACRLLERPSTDVVGITMPCFGTTDRTLQNALSLMQLLGVSVVQIDIKNAVTGHFADIGQDPTLYDATYENAQARERTQVLMDYAGRIGGIVVGTGDMSELALGWCTYNGDHMSMFGVNAGIPKTVIPHVIHAVAATDTVGVVAQVLQDVIDTPISPELLPPDGEGEIAQQTEDLVGPYALHDFYLYHVLHYGFSPEKIYTLACRAFDGIFAKEIVKKWLSVFYKRFFTQQFKRSCMPEGVQVFSVSLSPRGGWQMPSDATVSLWLRQVDAL